MPGIEPLSQLLLVVQFWMIRGRHTHLCAHLHYIRMLRRNSDINSSNGSPDWRHGGDILECREVPPIKESEGRSYMHPSPTIAHAFCIFGPSSCKSMQHGIFVQPALKLMQTHATSTSLSSDYLISYFFGWFRARRKTPMFELMRCVLGRSTNIYFFEVSPLQFIR